MGWIRMESMKTSQILFLIAGIAIFFVETKGVAGVIVYMLLPLGLCAIGAYLLVNGY